MPSTLKGPGLLAEYSDLLTTSSTQGGVQLGARASTGDGREFRYVLAGGTSLVPGKLQQAPVEDTTNYQNLAAAAAAIGATSLTISTSTTVAANVFAGGYVMATTSTGAGYTYQIKGNTATSGATGLVITLDDPIIVATTTGTRFDLQANPYSGVIVNPTSATSAPLGVAVFAVTNAQYGWIQTKGPANVLADGAITVGTGVVASNATAGAVEALTGVQAPVGTALTGIATTEYGAIMLNL